MPTPYYVPHSSPVNLRPCVQQIGRDIGPSRGGTGQLGTQICAHLFDASLVIGVSIYSANLITLGFLLLYGAELESSAHGANGLFSEVYDYTNGQLLGGCAAFFGVMYFVAFPAWKCQTLGMGLFGLRIISKMGEPPSLLALSRRFLICVLIYLSGGTLLLIGLRGRESRLLQDTYSGTTVIKAKGVPRVTRPADVDSALAAA